MLARVLLWLLVIVGCPSELFARQTAILLGSGTTAPDGRVLGDFAGALADATRGDVTFLGETQALMTKVAGVYQAVARTGDALPTLLAPGAFNAFDDPVINDNGMIAFTAHLDSDQARTGLFLWDGAQMTPVVVTGGALGGALAVTRPVDLNNANQIVFMDGSSAVYVYDHAAQAITQRVRVGDPAPLGGTFAGFEGRPLIGDGGQVVFRAKVGAVSAIFSSAPGGAISELVREGAPSPIAGATYQTFETVAVNIQRQVAFSARLSGGIRAIFRIDSGGTIVIARPGDLVGGSPITSIATDYVGVDSNGTVAFRALWGGASGFAIGSGAMLTGLVAAPSTQDVAPRLTDLGRIIWRQGGEVFVYDGATTQLTSRADTTPIGLGTLARKPSINGVDVPVFVARQAVLYRLERGVLTPLVSPGVATAGIPSFLTISAHAHQQKALAVKVQDAGAGRSIVGKRANDPWRLLASTGDAIPGGSGTLDPSEASFDVGTDGRLFYVAAFTGGAAASGLLSVDRKRKATTVIVREGDAAPGGSQFETFGTVRAVARRVVFAARTVDGRTGFYLGDLKGRLSMLARDGGPAPGTGGGTLGGLDLAAFGADRPGASFPADVIGGAVGRGIFHASLKGSVSPVLLDGDVAPGIMGGIVALGDDIVTQGRTNPVVSTDVSGAAVGHAVFAKTKGGLVPLAIEQDAVAPTGTLESLQLGAYALSAVKSGVVHVGGVVGIGAAVALLRSDP